MAAVPIAQRGQGRFHADDARREAHPHRVGQRDMGWKSESDVAAGSRRDRAVEVEEDSAGAHILGFGLEFVCPDRGEPLPAGAYQSAASSAVPESPVASVAYIPKACFSTKTNLNAVPEINLQAGRTRSHRPSTGPDYHQCIELPALCKSKKASGTDSVNVQRRLSDRQSRCHPLPVTFP